MNDGVLVVDMHGKIIFLNDKGCNMLGVDENVVREELRQGILR